MICRYHQIQLTKLDGAAPSPRLQTHLGACAGCREHQEKLKRLDTGLRANKEFAPRPELTASRPGLSGWTLASVTFAAVAAALLMYWNFQSSSETSPARTGNPMIASPVEKGTLLDKAVKAAGPDSNSSDSKLVAEEDTDSDRAMSTSSAFAGPLSRITALNSATPLEDELDALRSDGARGLKRLLALGSTKVATH